MCPRWITKTKQLQQGAREQDLAMAPAMGTRHAEAGSLPSQDKVRASRAGQAFSCLRLLEFAPYPGGQGMSEGHLQPEKLASGSSSFIGKEFLPCFPPGGVNHFTREVKWKSLGLFVSLRLEGGGRGCVQWLFPSGMC